jgi:hypothetical protein|uniref:Uncharacterized protein n=1 Tax=viral metagenome TaxID=1070528 RepID=A0A6C0EEE9_9ZZZZ
MYNFYEFFNISNNSSLKEIINAYKTKIILYNKIDKLSDRQKYEIKMLKIGLYILTNKNLKKKYNKIIEMKNKKSINLNTDPKIITEIHNSGNSEFINENKLTELIPVKVASVVDIKNNQEIINKDNVNENQQNFEPNDNNAQYDFNLDNLFKIDNSWMVNIEKKSEDSKKSRIDGYTFSDRIFSLPQSNKIYPSDFENEIRKKTQCREIKLD